MEQNLLVVGLVGNVISVLLFASPIKTFWRIVKNRSTEEFKPAPYVVTLLASSLWVYYGVTKPDVLVATINGAGVFSQAIYVSLFLVYASPARRAEAALLVAILDVGFVGAVVLVTQLAMHEPLRIMVIGSVCACLNVFMYGSPLAVMKTVITTKNVEYMPFFLSFFLFLNGGVWTLYAVLESDVFLGIPNGIGFFLGSVQLIIYVIYMNAKLPTCSGEAETVQAYQRLIEPVEC